MFRAGIKLRPMQTRGRGSNYVARTAWRIPPRAQSRFLDLHPRFMHRRQFKTGSPDYMDLFMCNDPQATGYSFLVQDTNKGDAQWPHDVWVGLFKVIHTHKAGEDLSCYSREAAQCWLYSPVSKGESITHVYRRKERIVRNQAIVVSPTYSVPPACELTDVFCAVQDQQGSTLLCRRVLEAREQVGGQGGAVAAMGPASTDETRHLLLICAFAFNNEFEYQEGLDGPLPLASDNSLNSRKEPFFYSRADLSGLLHVTICRIGDSDVVSGLLLHFYDDRTEAVGQVRLDFLRDELPAGHAKPLYLGFKRDGDGCPYVSTVSNSPIRDPGIESVIKLSGGGMLE